jgi:hypothetical protein
MSWSTSSAPRLLAAACLVCACAGKGRKSGLVTSERQRDIEREADNQNERAYEQALGAAGLVRVASPGPLETFDRDDPEREDVYYTGYWSREQRGGPQSVEFGKDAQGSLWHLDREPKDPQTESYTIPGCYSLYSGGETPEVFRVGYVLPEGVTVAGRKTIAYPARIVSFHERGGVCDTGPPRP